MNIVLAAVMSIDGRIKRDERIHERDWISHEDKAYFNHLMNKHEVIVMGRKTYQSMKLHVLPKKRYIVMTRRPEKYHHKTIAGALEFTDDTPITILDRLTGLDTLLVIGGSEIYGAFLKADLVDELHITIEPIIFGSGVSLVAGEGIGTKFQLIEICRLNQAGTVLMKMKPRGKVMEK